MSWHIIKLMFINERHAILKVGLHFLLLITLRAQYEAFGKWTCTKERGIELSVNRVRSYNNNNQRVLCIFSPKEGGMQADGEFLWKFREMNTSAGDMKLSVGFTPYYSNNATDVRGFFYDTSVGSYGERIEKGDTISMFLKLQRRLTEVHVFHNNYYLGPLYKVKSNYSKKLYPMVKFSGMVDVKIERSTFNFQMPLHKSRTQVVANVYRPHLCYNYESNGDYSLACKQYVFHISLLEHRRFPKDVSKAKDLKFQVNVIGINKYFGVMNTHDGIHYESRMTKQSGNRVTVDQSRAELLIDRLFNGEIKINVPSETRILVEKVDTTDDQRVYLELDETQNPLFPITTFDFDEVDD